MPATRSQRAQLASPLASTTRKRSVSRAVSAEPSATKVPPKAKAPAAAATTTTTTGASAATSVKRKWSAEPEVGEEVEAVEEEAGPPKKKNKSLKDLLFREDLKRRVEEKRRLEEPLPRKAYGPPTYPFPTTPLPPPPVAPQSQPQPARGFFGRLMDTITPFRRAMTPSARPDSLADARIDLYQLQKHTQLQQKLNQEINQTIHAEELQHQQQQQQQQQAPPAAAHHEKGRVEQVEKTRTGDKRKRSAANKITGLSPLIDISESPEYRRTDEMRTPSRAPTSYNGLVPKSLPKQRRTYKEARAAAAAKGMRNINDPLTPATSRTAPTTPYDKNAYARIRRVREIEQLRVQQKAAEDKLAKIHAEQEAEAEIQPRKTKRVKLDHLKAIPHNRPGESSGCFRVPDYDSDDEMEVDESAELIENPFATVEDVAEDAPQKPQASPAKTSAATPFTSTPFTAPSLAAPVAQQAPAQTLPPVEKPACPLKRAVSPVKRAASPEKQATSPLKKVTNVFEVEDDAPDNQSTTSPEPAQVFTDIEASDNSSDMSPEDWPELPSRKEGEPEPPQWWKDEALAKFNEDFEHWQQTGEMQDL